MYGRASRWEAGPQMCDGGLWPNGPVSMQSQTTNSIKTAQWRCDEPVITVFSHLLCFFLKLPDELLKFHYCIFSLNWLFIMQLL